jgi:hypothetical protein
MTEESIVTRNIFCRKQSDLPHDETIEGRTGCTIAFNVTIFDNTPGFKMNPNKSIRNIRPKPPYAKVIRASYFETPSPSQLLHNPD